MRLPAAAAQRRLRFGRSPSQLLRSAAAASLGWRLAVLAAALGLWQALSASGVLRPDEFPSMTSSVAALWSAVGGTLAAWAIGMVIAGLAAVVVGTLLGSSSFAYRSASPVIEFFKTIPVVAILPIALVLYGPTLKERYVLVAFAVFWPLVIQVIYGVRSIDPTVLDTARALKVRRLRRFFVVVLPSAAPFIATGLRVAAAVALVVDIVAELIGGGGNGVGIQLLTAQNSGPTAYPLMYAYILVAGLLGVAAAGSFALAERQLLHWHEAQRNLRASHAV